MLTWIDEALRRRRIRLEELSPSSFVWRDYRKRPNWVFTCCFALGCGAGGYYLATVSNPMTRSDPQQVEQTTGVQVEKPDNRKPDDVAARKETPATVPPVVVLNRGTADSSEKTNRLTPMNSAAAPSRSRATPRTRRSGDHSASRSWPTSYRSYKDLRDFTLNR